MGIGKARGFVADDQVGGERQFEPASVADPFDHRDVFLGLCIVLVEFQHLSIATQRTGIATHGRKAGIRHRRIRCGKVGIGQGFCEFRRLGIARTRFFEQGSML